MPDLRRSHLMEFCLTRDGVEAWIEDATGINKTSLLLVAWDGEWTRRAVPSTEWAQHFADRMGLAVHVAGLEPYPVRMRDWDERRRRDARRAGG